MVQVSETDPPLALMELLTKQSPFVKTKWNRKLKQSDRLISK